MNTNIIEYIIKNKKIKQNVIAKKLGVTTGQISKWKQGEYISSERRLELNKLAGLFSDNPDWVDISKTKRNAESWFKYINQLSDNANIEIAEFQDNQEISIPPLFICLSQLGVEIPKKAISVDDLEWSNFHNLITKLLEALIVIFQWNLRHFSELSKFDDISETLQEINSKSLNIAVINLSDTDRAGIKINETLFNNYEVETKNHVRGLIQKLLRQMNANRIPITEDYFVVINESTHWLDLKLSFDNDDDNITNYLSYSERKKLESKQYETELLESLHQKVNSLLKDQKLKISPNRKAY